MHKLEFPWNILVIYYFKKNKASVTSNHNSVIKICQSENSDFNFTKDTLE